MARNNQRQSKNNNPEGRNQYSGGFADLARERPFTTAAVAAGAAATGLFLWSKRSQISDQISGLSDQIGQWSENMRSGDEAGLFSAEDSGSEALVGNRGRRSTAKNQQEFAEEAMTLKETGNPGANGSVSGRGRKASAPTS